MNSGPTPFELPEVNCRNSHWKSRGDDRGCPGDADPRSAPRLPLTEPAHETQAQGRRGETAETDREGAAAGLMPLTTSA